MIRSSLLLLIACLVAVPHAGCTTMESWRSARGKRNQSVNSNSMEQRTADFDADEVDEDPQNYVGDESRAELAIEEPLDPWFGKYNYADKGRAIERNLR